MKRFAIGAERHNHTSVWVVDEHGCLLHTEPVCVVFTGPTGHSWFVEGLEGQPCSYPGGPVAVASDAGRDAGDVQARKQL